MNSSLTLSRKILIPSFSKLFNFHRSYNSLSASALPTSTSTFLNQRFTNGSTSPKNFRQIHLTSNPVCKKAKPSKNLPVLDDLDEGENDPDEDFELMGKGDQVVRLWVATDRLDAVLKAGLSLSRNKIEKAFYSDRIRVNGDRPKKKSAVVGEGDEIDLVRRYNAKTPAYLDVSRLEILEMGTYTRRNEDDDDEDAKIPVKVKRYKNITVENYPVPVKGNLNED